MNAIRSDNFMGFIVFIVLASLFFVFWNGAKLFGYIPTRLEDWIERNGWIKSVIAFLLLLLSIFLEQFLPSLSRR